MSTPQVWESKQQHAEFWKQKAFQAIELSKTHRLVGMSDHHFLLYLAGQRRRTAYRILKELRNAPSA